MLRRTALHILIFGAVWILSLVFAISACAEIGIDRDFSGRVNIESRWFPQAGAFSGQGSHAIGFFVEPKLYLADARGRSFTLSSFFRYDNADSRRTHVDLREAYFLLFGEIGDGEWELRVGIDQVFWGVTESQHLVDIINQIDLVEHPNGETKLGQPMVNITYSSDWGIVEFFVLPYHRARTFPGSSGRLRLPLVVEDEQVEYESEAHLDFAARYSQSFGVVDVGLSVFNGTSREPFLFPGMDSSGVPVLFQHYGQIRQFGLDAQLTVGSWLFKLEAIQRAGARNLLGMEEDYVASVFGGEYTFYSVFDSAVDLSLLGEWNYDGRERNATPSRSPNTLENDFFFATRLAFNDVQSTEIVASVLGDAGRSTRALFVELDRRISDQLSLNIEVIHLLSIDQADIHYDTRRDSFIDLRLIYNF
ncbi:MAG: hypothetical protein J4F29_13800 [Candidatus Latescibacteria bacterium]|nr:hypothetical protein [Candidatus Latescibacterota bacterium]